MREAREILGGGIPTPVRFVVAAFSGRGSLESILRSVFLNRLEAINIRDLARLVSLEFASTAEGRVMRRRDSDPTHHLRGSMDQWCDFVLLFHSKIHPFGWNGAGGVKCDSM